MKVKKESVSEGEGEDFDFFSLDQYRLDEEWVNQPRLYFEWATKLADAKEELERAKADRDMVVAKLDRNIRTEPLTYDLPKVTEGAVEKTITLQPLYKDARDRVIAATSSVDHIEAVVKSLDHRKKALENLVYLHGQSYFAEPRAPTGMKGKMEEATKAQVRGRARRAINEP